MKGLNLKLALTLEKEYTQHSTGRGAYTALLISDILLMLTFDLSHETADRLAGKVFFTKRCPQL